MSIVTRTLPRRREFLKINRDSVRAQSSRRWEQWLLVDSEERGLEFANGLFARHREIVRGRYVLMLDDDNRFAVDSAISELERFATSAGYPDLVMFRSDHGPLGTLPGPPSWGKSPVLAQVDTCNFIAERRFWQRHIDAFAEGWAGDFAFLEACWPEASVAWLDRILCEVQQIGAIADRRA